MDNSSSVYQPTLKFGDRFLLDHAGSIINDPKIAVVELIANCWDAGADQVDICWFLNGKQCIEIKDNGTGMTPDEFERRWHELNYNRRDAQGIDVIFPQGNFASARKVFGRNGKGRHGMFCFADEYFVETKKDGWKSTFKISRVFGRTSAPFEGTRLDVERISSQEHGTRIWANCNYDFLLEEDLRDLVGSKFIADPSFTVFVNQRKVELTDLSHLFDEKEITIKDIGQVYVLMFDTENISKSTKQHGVAWWVNNRLVGDVAWRKLDGTSYLDGRMSNAKRFTFVVRADILQDQVLADWSGFRKPSAMTKEVANVVEDYIIDRLHDLFLSTYKDRKKKAVEDNKAELANLSPASRGLIGHYLDEIQIKCPTIRPEHLSATVEVLANLERSRSGYALLQQLARLRPGDLDSLHELLAKWTVQEAQVVLDELQKRLKLIERLESLVEDTTANELHDIQPLFERGLWIFGPEYESIEFTSNRSLATVLKNLLHDSHSSLSTPRRRPDFVALPDTSIGIYSRDAFDENGDVMGISKVLIVELKRGGFDITRDEIRQAEDYEIEIRRSGKISHDTQVVVFVLGATLGNDARASRKIGDNTFIHPRTYGTVLRQAHARTFFLTDKLKQVAGRESQVDPEIEAIMDTSAIQAPLWYE